MNLHKALEILHMSGIKALPVPGTANYTVTYPNGKTATVKENQLAQLAAQAGGNIDDVPSGIQQPSM